MSRKNNLFTHVPVQRVNRNLFDLSHEVKMSGKMGFLYPVLCMDTLPGDTFRDQMTVFARFAPMLAPIMHRIDVKTHFFFVPNRLLTDHWEDFITGGQDGTAAPILPFVRPVGLGEAQLQKGSLMNCLGFPPLEGVNDSVEQVSVLPVKAYVKIWNDFYRDPNLDEAVDLDLDALGNSEVAFDANGWGILRRKGWERDYFTSALPWAQRGSEVLMPLAGTGSVTYRTQSELVPGDANVALGTGPTGLLVTDFGGTPSAARLENIDEVQLDSSDVSINDLRRSIAIQVWLENNARGGGRYIEQLESHFGQRVPDYRLQRAEYLGGGSQPLTISEVLATADTEGVPVGDMAGHGISAGKSNRFTYRCQEHGWIIGILSVIPRTAYFQGIERMWSRSTKFDYAWPELAHLGEQEILSKELFFSYNNAHHAANQGTFGYIPRYSEYKFKNDRVVGDFTDNLLFWHEGRKFITRPSLDSDFTTMLEDGVNADAEQLETSFRRIFAVQDGTDYIWLQLFHRCTAVRPLPYFGVPTSLGIM